ncbi:aldehyde-activating protein [Dyella jiangningensis]|uniref:Aldehyde-activating protein n=2 Tax=Dyella jiangningensis TaxID=1379159 RepID=A0A328P6V3_9GAMM|nr:aldehyde-activating protein [Dyella jiangningensis]
MQKGSCHCGRITFEVEGEPTQAIECNCTHCSRKGFLLWFVPRARFHLHAAEDALSSYQFNRHMIDHRFCPHCGCQPFAYGKDPKSGDDMVAVNVRCLEGIELASVERRSFDGLHLL